MLGTEEQRTIFGHLETLWTISWLTGLMAYWAHGLQDAPFSEVAEKLRYREAESLSVNCFVCHGRRDNAECLGYVLKSLTSPTYVQM